MIPNGSELTCTRRFEIDDPKVRARILGALGGVEDHIFLSINGERIAATTEGDVERSTPEGKASSVHFLHFSFADAQILTWKSGVVQAMVDIDTHHSGIFAFFFYVKLRVLVYDGVCSHQGL